MPANCVPLHVVGEWSAFSLPNPVFRLRSHQNSSAIAYQAHRSGSTCVGSFLPTMFLNRTGVADPALGAAFVCRACFFSRRSSSCVAVPRGGRNQLFPAEEQRGRRQDDTAFSSNFSAFPLTQAPRRQRPRCPACRFRSLAPAAPHPGLITTSSNCLVFGSQPLQIRCADSSREVTTLPRNIGPYRVTLPKSPHEISLSTGKFLSAHPAPSQKGLSPRPWPLSLVQRLSH